MLAQTTAPTTLETARAFAESVMSIFAIVNPIGSLPFLVALTQGTNPEQRKRLIRIACVTAVAIVSVIAVAGNFLLHNVFQVRIPEFAFGGGLLLIVVGIKSILEDPTDEDVKPAAELESRRIIMAVSPIACPLLVGPGTIVTTLLIANLHGVLYALCACLAAFVFVILILNFSHVLFKIMGPVITLAVGRIMDIFIVAIGVQFLFNSLREVFPALAGK